MIFLSNKTLFYADGAEDTPPRFFPSAPKKGSNLSESNLVTTQQTQEGKKSRPLPEPIVGQTPTGPGLEEESPVQKEGGCWARMFWGDSRYHLWKLSQKSHVKALESDGLSMCKSRQT